MSSEGMKKTLTAAIACFNDPARRAEYFDIIYEDDVVLHGYTPGPLANKENVKAFYQPLFDAFPDCRVHVEAMYTDGDVLTVRFEFAGTQTGTFQNLAPSGKQFRVPGITILRFGGPGKRCVERWSVTDFLSMMMQLGAIPAPPSPSQA